MNKNTLHLQSHIQHTRTNNGDSNNSDNVNDFRKSIMICEIIDSMDNHFCGLDVFGKELLGCRLILTVTSNSLTNCAC